MLLVILLLFAVTLTAQTTPQDFSIVLLPDTQFYSELHPLIFEQQTKWIVDNRAKWNIQAVLGEGDIVNTPSKAYEWVNADTAIKTLDAAGIPYALAIGNHDYDNVAPSSRGTVAYNQTFGVSRYLSKPWYIGHFGTTNENFYIEFTVNGQRYIVLALEYYPRTAVLDWADDLMTANSEAIFLITTHSFEYTDGARQDVCDTQDMRNSGNNAESVWQAVLKKHVNVQLVVSGHLIGNNTAHRTDVALNGNLVHQIFTNFQNITNGGNGFLRILKFRPAINKIEVYTYSPSLNQSLTTAAHQFTLPIANIGNTAITGALEGKVRLPNCTNIAGAQVTAGPTTVTSDSNGHYKITSLNPEDSELVSETATGYLPQSKSNPVYAGFSTQTNFYLSAAIHASCTLSTVDPSVTICTPTANATVASPVHINAGSTTSVGTNQMQVYIDGINKANAFASAIDTNVAMTTGAHRLTVQAILNNGALTKSTININVGTSPPPPTNGITMTSPVNGSTVANPVAVKATATSTVAISFIELWIDGLKKSQVNGASLNTTVTLTAGSHRITTQARDANGVYYKATATITVK